MRKLGWVFLAPALAVILLVGLYPLVLTFWISLTDARLGSPTAPSMIGFQNYVTLFGEAEFWGSVLTTVIFTVSSVGIELVLGMGLALVVNSQFKGRGAVRAAMLIPWALPTVVSAKMWTFMFQDTYGVVNDILYGKLGWLEYRWAWLGDPALALSAIIAVDVWKTTPFVALLLLAGLQVISDDVYEAAEVDGATPWQRFTRITLPLLKPAILVVLVFRTLDALRVFDVVWVMTAGALETETMATYNYRHMISFQKFGYGAAISVSIFLIVSIFVAAYLVLLRDRGEDAA